MVILPSHIKQCPHIATLNTVCTKQWGMQPLGSTSPIRITNICYDIV